MNQTNLQTFGFDSELIICRKIKRYEHIGCGGTVISCSMFEDEIVKEHFSGDYKAFWDYLDLSGIKPSRAWICARCLKIIDSIEVSGDYGFTFIPDPKEARFTEKLLYEPYERHVDIIKKAYLNVRKYKNGKSTRDTWLAGEIARILKKEGLGVEGVHESELRSAVLGMPVVDWAIRRGFFRIIKEVEYDIPYAYRKYGRWKGIKHTVFWRVLEPTKSFYELLG